MLMPYALALIVFASVALVAWAAMSLVFSDERAVGKRLQGLTAYETTQASSAYPQLRPFSERVAKPGGQRVKDVIAQVAPSGYRASIARRLVLAGKPRGLDGDRFVLAKLFLAVGIGALAVVGAVISNASALVWLLTIGVTVLAFFAPDLWLSSRIEARQKEIRTELPDLLDMLTISVEAGLGFDQAIAKIVRTTHGTLSHELARMLQEIQAGSDRSEALKHMGERTDVPQLNAFITAIVQAEQLGIPIANVLRTQAREMRLTRRQKAEEQAQKTPVKIVFPLILCILPATMIVILGPAVISIGTAFGVW